MVAIDASRLEYAGAGDLVAAAVFCAPAKVDFFMVKGRLVVEEGRLTTMEIQPIMARHNEIAREMLT